MRLIKVGVMGRQKSAAPVLRYPLIYTAQMQKSKLAWKKAKQ